MEREREREKGGEGEGAEVGEVDTKGLNKIHLPVHYTKKRWTDRTLKFNVLLVTRQ